MCVWRMGYQPRQPYLVPSWFRPFWEDLHCSQTCPFLEKTMKIQISKKSWIEPWNLDAHCHQHPPLGEAALVQSRWRRSTKFTWILGIFQRSRCCLFSRRLVPKTVWWSLWKMSTHVHNACVRRSQLKEKGQPCLAHSASTGMWELISSIFLGEGPLIPLSTWSATEPTISR